MNKQTTSNLFMVSSMPRLYQRLLNGISDYHQLGNRIIREIKAAHAFRDVNEVQQMADILINLPIPEYKLIGQYYLGWCAYRQGSDAKTVFERVAEYGPMEYRIRAFQSLAAIEARNQNHEQELYWLTESLKLKPSVESLRGIAIVKAKEGHGSKAIKDLERLLPLARFSDPLIWHSFLNSLATELGEAGRKEEARDVSRIVLASPFILAYPEWQQTAIDVQPPNRSFAFVNPLIGENVLRFRPSKQPSQWSRRLAKLLIFGRPFGAAMKKKKQDDKKQQIIDQYSKMTKTEKAKMIRQRVMNDDLPDDVIEGMLHILTEYELNR